VLRIGQSVSPLEQEKKEKKKNLIESFVFASRNHSACWGQSASCSWCAPCGGLRFFFLRRGPGSELEPLSVDDSPNARGFR
jgi:hypothetical protein